MSKNIKTPTNVKLLTNVAVVRMKKIGKRFEIACYKNKVLSWRNKTEKDIDEVLQTPIVFTNVSKGQLAKKDELIAAFGTDDQLEVCKQILEKGDLQVSDKERQAASDQSLKEVSQLIASMVVNPETKRPIPPSVIDKALQDVHFSLKPNRSTKQQALDAIPKLRETMKIERAKMRIRISLPSKEAKQHHTKLKSLFFSVEMEDWAEAGLELVGLIEPGQFRAVDECIRNDTHGSGRLEILSLKDVVEDIMSIYGGLHLKSIRPFSNLLRDPIFSAQSLGQFRDLLLLDDETYLSYLLLIEANVAFALRNSVCEGNYVHDLLIELQGMIDKAEQSEISEELVCLSKQVFFKCSADFLVNNTCEEKKDVICILSSLSYRSVDCITFDKGDVSAYSASLALDSLSLLLELYQDEIGEKWRDPDVGGQIAVAIIPNDRSIRRLHASVFQNEIDPAESLLPVLDKRLPETFADRLSSVLDIEEVLKIIIIVLRRCTNSTKPTDFSLFRFFLYLVKDLKLSPNEEEFSKFDVKFFTAADFAIFIEWLNQCSQNSMNGVKVAVKINFNKTQLLHWQAVCACIRDKNIGMENRLRVATVIRTVRLDREFRNIRILFNIFKFIEHRSFPTEWLSIYASLIIKNLHNVEYTECPKDHLFRIVDGDESVTVDDEERIFSHVEAFLVSQPRHESEQDQDRIVHGYSDYSDESSSSSTKSLNQPRAELCDDFDNSHHSVKVKTPEEPVEDTDDNCLQQNDLNDLSLDEVEAYYLNSAEQALHLSQMLFKNMQINSENQERCRERELDYLRAEVIRLGNELGKQTMGTGPIPQLSNLRYISNDAEKKNSDSTANGVVSFLNKQLKLDKSSDAEAVATYIENTPYMKVLELKGNTLGIEAGERIAIALRKHPELEHCLWSDLFTGRLKNEIPPVLRSLTSSMTEIGCHITELDLSDNAFGPIGAEGIQDFLVSRSAFTLETLKLNNNGLGSGGKIIADCLKKCFMNAQHNGRQFKLKTFIAGRNRLEDPGAIALAEAFKLIRTLEHVEVPQNGIRQEGIIALANSFEANLNLKTIVLNDNTCLPKGAHHVAQSLKKLFLLEVLDLGDCLCKSSGCGYIIDAVCDGRHCNIKTVDLSGSEMSGEKAKSILASWKEQFGGTDSRLLINNNMFGKSFRDIETYIEIMKLKVDLGDISDDEGSASERYSSSSSSDEEFSDDHSDDFSNNLQLQTSLISANDAEKKNSDSTANGVVSFLNKQLKLDKSSDAEAVATYIENTPYMKVLELKGNTLGIEAGERIAIALRKHPELEHCLWSDLFTGRLKNEIPPVLRSLTSSMTEIGCHITELDLSDNAFGPIGAEGIQDFLVSRSAFTLETLKLNNNGLGSGGKIIADCLKKCFMNAQHNGRQFKLKTFIAGRNRLEDPGAIALAEAFKLIRTLEHIEVPQNGIRQEGIIALANSFEVNRSLKTIVLNDNTCLATGAYHVAKSLTDLTNLEILDLGDCLCKSAGCGAVVAVICDGRHHNIKFVDLSGSEMSGQQAKGMMTSWEQSFSGMNALLKIGNNNFGSAFPDLQQRIEKKKLNIDIGDIDDDEGSSSERDSDKSD